MKNIWKNQLKVIWKHWVSYVGIFLLLILSVFLTSSALATNSNINRVVASLTSSNQYQLQVKLLSNFSSNGLKVITDYFFKQPFNDPTFQIRYQIERNEVIPVDYHAVEIKAWNYNFQAWLMQHMLSKLNRSYQVAVDYRVSKLNGFINQQVYQINAYNGFNDVNWSKPVALGGHGYLNLKQQNLVIISRGRAAINDNEVVVNINAGNQHNPDLMIGKNLMINQQVYQIVGQGYNYASYFHDFFYQTANQQQVNLWFTNSAANQFWLKTGQTLNFVNRRAAYYINAPPSQIKSIRTALMNNYANVTQTGVINTNQLKNNDTKYQLAITEITLFMVIGALLFVITIMITTIFLRKALNQQKYSLGLLIALGQSPTKLALVIGTAFLTFLFVPVIFGFAGSFGLQTYLTLLVSRIIFYPFAFTNWSWLAAVINLMILPLILAIAVIGFTFYSLSQKVILLLTNQPKIKRHHYRAEKQFKQHWKLINTKLAIAFARSNQRKIVGTIIIYCLNVFLVLFLFFLISAYHNSLNFLQKSYTNYGNREFISENTTLSNTFQALWQNHSYQFNEEDDYHWVTSQDFHQAITQQTGKYHNITLDYLAKHNDLKNCYFSPETVAFLAPNLELFQQYDFDLYQTFVTARQYWVKYQVYPYITFNFKIYDADSSLLATRLPVFLDNRSSESSTNLTLTAYQNQDFAKWVYLKTNQNQQAIQRLEQGNHQFVNGIISAQIAKHYQLNVDDLIWLSTSLSNQALSGLKIPIKIVGINQYNYVNNQVIVNQTTLFNYLITQFQIVNPTKMMRIDPLINLSNLMLVRNQLPEVTQNLSLINLQQNYQPDQNYHYHLQPSSTSYLTQSYPPVVSQLYITSLVQGVTVLLVFILIIGLIVILVLFYLMLGENLNEMLSLKFLGYPSSRIISWIIVPYLIGMVISSLAIVALCYFGLKLLLGWLYKNTQVLLFFYFSPAILIGFAISLVLMLLIMILIGFWQIKQGKLAVLKANEQ